MRGTIGRSFTSPSNFHITNVTKQTPFLIQSSSSSFSTSSSGGAGGGGRGRGRGGGVGSPSSSAQFDFSRAPGKPESDEPKPESTESRPTGLGHGRGRRMVVPPLSDFIEFANAYTGAGRGKPAKQPEPAPQIMEANRHIRARPREAKTVADPSRPKLSAEEAVKNAVRILSRGGGDAEEQEAGIGRGRGGRMGGRGRGRGRGRGWREGGERRGRDQDPEESFAFGLYVGDNADGEKLAKRLGPENMNKLVEGFEEMSGRVLPSPLEDEYLDALHTNLLIELEPEYLMGEFDRNPDIDEKPPIPLRDALEKVKPFLMVYEGIQNQEEWEEAVNEVMERVPLLKEIVDHYSGPDRVTAKKQWEELERVASTIPEKAPDSVKRFANHAVLSLQSNPGWGFDKKCQFMDKLVWEVSQHYK